MSGAQYNAFPIFWLVPTSVNVSIEYSTEVMYQFCLNGTPDELKVSGTSPQEMKKSENIPENNRR